MRGTYALCFSLLLMGCSSEPTKDIIVEADAPLNNVVIGSLGHWVILWRGGYSQSRA